MKKLLLLIVLLFSIQFVNGQGPGNPPMPAWIILTSQNEVDSFPINYPISGVLDSNLAIVGDDITNLDSLASIVTINGHLSIGGMPMVFPPVPTVMPIGNPLLLDISAFANLDSIHGGLFIMKNASLNSLSDLSGLDNIMGDLIIEDNDALTNLEGLEGITKVGHNFSIGKNENLSSIEALASITEIDFFLFVTDNPSLSNLNGLENIDYETIWALSITGNTILSECSVESICNDILLDSTNVDISNNALGCNSEAEVEAACTTSLAVDELSEQSISIYPNPASNYITISSEENTIKNIHIFNHLGQAMPVKGNSVIDVSTFPSGIYIMEVEVNGNIIRKRVVVE